MTWRPALWLVALVVIALDQLTKQWALTALEPGEKHAVLGDLLSFQLVFNSGAAFSLGDGYTWVMTIVAVIVTIGIVYFARRAQSRLAIALFGIGLGGAVGNLIDRLLREPGFGQGHVVDMINYNGWFVGNVADLAIVGVAAVVLVMSLTNRSLLAPAPRHESADEAQSSDATVGEEPRG
ncbi:signal peptidase II [Demequina muriae]|uniref:Lipoprotein signal peptidase n=1 Tax=Demequina muriae TaxID=3051664 RepID=A0ABT8GE05_9MICO|nr:signal peptidase II [Demequina sp. EGI L300058]MDN4479509.1 signal peptidase II [Demequina sp. EGI L300058]